MTPDEHQGNIADGCATALLGSAALAALAALIYHAVTALTN